MRRVRGLAPPLLLLAGVACVDLESGPPFAPLPSQPPDKAIVYVYRNPKFLTGGVMGVVGLYTDVYTVNATGKPLVKLLPGGYIALVAEPRETEFSATTEATSSITLDLEAGETYYLKGDIEGGIVRVHPKLTLVDDAVGASEIRECRKLQPASLGLDTP